MEIYKQYAKHYKLY